MRIGICGYGNVGKAVERNIFQQGRDELVAIFSRRNNLKSDYGTPIEKYSFAPSYQNEIDVMIMCGGSQEDLEWQSVEMLQYFDIIDTFDTHERIEMHKQNLEKVCKQSGGVAIYSCGWDPGIFSMIRTLSANIFNQAPVTFWGKGVSQGHSEALRNIRGVEDAIQFTVPNQEVYNKVKNSPMEKVDKNDMHERHCFVSLTGERSLSEIERDINNTENYFKGQKVFVTECSFDEVQRMKSKMYHKGSVVGGDEQSSLNLKVQMESNPDFTAQILLAYVEAVPKLENGVYSVLDIPIHFIEKSYHKYL